jgi:ADP-L-glycero-D-manno-heptose 6-epimerase
MIVVTGGAGFIGSNIVAALADEGAHRIIVCDRFGDDDKWRNLAKHEVADIVAPEALADYLKDFAGAIEAVIHMGAITSTSERDVDRLIADNFQFSLDLWHWCAANGVRLIYASSAATYGDGGEGFDDDGSVEALARLRPRNPYGWSKHLFDRRVARLVADGGPAPPQWAGLKFFNVYGPNEYHKGEMQSVVASSFPDAAAGRPVRLFKSHHPDYPDGGQLRDFVWVGDCVAVIQWLLSEPRVEGLFNIGTGEARSFADLAAATFAGLGLETKIDYIDTPAELREGYQYFTQAEMGRLRAAGFERSFTSLEEGVGRYVRNFLSRDDIYR